MRIRWSRKAIRRDARGNPVSGCWEHNGRLDGVVMFNVTVSDGSDVAPRIEASSRIRGLWSTAEPRPGIDHERSPDFAGDRNGAEPYASPEAAMADVERRWEAWKARFAPAGR